MIMAAARTDLRRLAVLTAFGGALVAAALGAGSATTLATMLSTTTNPNNAVSNVVLYAPTGLASVHQGSANALTWTAASPMNGQGYVIRGVNNGASSTCPASAASYTTLVGSTAGTSFTDSGSSLLSGAGGSYVCYLVQTGYSSAGGPPWASVPSWTSVNSLTTVATAIKGKVQQASATGALATATATFAAATNAGNLLVAFMSNQTGISVATFPAGWVSATSGSGGANKEGAVIYYYANNPGGITSVNATMVGAGGVSLIIAEFAGVATTSALDTTGSTALAAKNTTGSVSTVAATTYSGELAVAAWGINSGGAQTWGESAGFTSVTTAGAGGGSPSDMGRETTGAGGVVTETETWTSNAWAVGLVAVFK